MAGELGFEPRLTESESAVLPLNYSPPNCVHYQQLELAVLQIRQRSFANLGAAREYMRPALFSV
jgi:hypothetical protein